MTTVPSGRRRRKLPLWLIPPLIGLLILAALVLLAPHTIVPSVYARP
jgi:hypothetical protein